MTTLIHSARIVTAGQITENGWVLFDEERIAATGTGRAPDAGTETGTETEIVDAAGRWLTPGFIDIHCHGGGGASVDDGAEGIRRTLAVHAEHGTTRSVLSLVTADIPTLERRLDAIARFAESEPRVLGAHLEGPFLDVGHKGAHDPTLLRGADDAAVDALLAAARGHLRQVTLAPEQPGGMAAIRRFAQNGVAVAVGHTDADYQQTRAAFDAGARILTHAFNAMRGIHHRNPGPVAAAMHDSRVTLELINDGVHVHPDVIHLAFAGAPGRIAMITDAMAAAGASDGEYILGSLAVTVTDGVARLTDGDSIAGSTLTLDAALRQAVETVGITIETAVQALTATPARAIGRAHDLGDLAPGFLADAVLLDERLRVEQVWAAGRSLIH